MITLAVKLGAVAGFVAIGIIVAAALYMVYQYGKKAGRKQ